MSGPYTKVWRSMGGGVRADDPGCFTVRYEGEQHEFPHEVVPLSDAERMRGAIEQAIARIERATDAEWGDDYEGEVNWAVHDLQVALNPEQSK